MATWAFSLRVSTGRGQCLQRLDGTLGAAIQSALEIDRAGAGDDVAHAVGEDRMREDGRGAGAVADHVAGPLGRLPQHLRAEVLLRVLEIEFLGDGDAVVADDRRSPFSSISTDLDRGPSVTRTASANCVAPRKIFSRASERNRTCLCAMVTAPQSALGTGLNFGCRR